MKKMTPEELEKFIHQNLRSLPPRRAPRSLESRVMAAIEHQAAIAWYHKSWSYWPAAVRVAFLGAGTAVAAAAVAGFYLVSQGAAVDAVAGELGAGFGWVSRIIAGGNWVVNFAQQQIGTIPSLWLYGSLAFFAAMYVTFIGLGTAAYRYLYRTN